MRRNVSIQAVFDRAAFRLQRDFPGCATGAVSSTLRTTARLSGPASGVPAASESAGAANQVRRQDAQRRVRPSPSCSGDSE
ncbi:hypothetical protein NK718_09305 [Alsobacter sp. SYSU M60028]|uniref:Uncharacterized protein n=1 Tax=Alsobacter ponti TaxID=2962936 RepID=A0ABT1LB50_9HYPH|nr:hypothetical protein [Alsobacter ponti]MCP8938710.1 hypothetical protein [Alsobacter ponti]